MNLLDIAIQAALESGKKIREVYDSSYEVEYKEDSSPVTTADLKANRVICDFLIKTNIPIISEENKRTEYSERKHWSRCWVVDPLDGTKEFVKRNGEFTVNIALVENGSPIMGVIYAPVTKTLYYADENGSFKVESITDFSELKTSEAKKLHIRERGESVSVLVSRSHANQETDDYLQELEKRYKLEPMSVGSSLKFCKIAEGSADIYARFAPTMEWDTAAGEVIACQAGATMLQSTGEPMQYNKENLLNPYFIVENHDQK